MIKALLSEWTSVVCLSILLWLVIFGGMQVSCEDEPSKCGLCITDTECAEMYGGNGDPEIVEAAR